MLILFINIYSSVKLDDEEYGEDGILIEEEDENYVDEEDEDDDDEEEDHAMPDLSEFTSHEDAYPGPPDWP
jgi:hypothetical protein